MNILEFSQSEHVLQWKLITASSIIGIITTIAYFWYSGWAIMQKTTEYEALGKQKNILLGIFIVSLEPRSSSVVLCMVT